VNGRIAKILRGRFGTGAAYKNAKRQIDSMPTAFAQRPKLVKEREHKNLLTGKPPQPMASSGWKRTGPVIVVRRYWPGQNHKTGRIAA
jgi:hypothetical protein